MVNFASSKKSQPDLTIRLPYGRTASNHLAGIEVNCIDMMRHGWALHNELGKLASAFPEPFEIPLLPKGAAQVEQGFRTYLPVLRAMGRPLVIVSAPSKRTRQSAAIGMDILSGMGVTLEIRAELRERDCGKLLEGFRYRSYLKYFKKSLEHQDEVEMAGKSRIKSLLHRSRILEIPSNLCRIEPCKSVESRVTSIMREMQVRGNMTNERFVFVTHEFTGALALNALLHRPPGMFWENRHIPNGKIIQLDKSTARRHFGLDQEDSPMQLRDFVFSKSA